MGVCTCRDFSESEYQNWDRRYRCVCSAHAHCRLGHLVFALFLFTSLPFVFLCSFLFVFLLVLTLLSCVVVCELCCSVATGSMDEITKKKKGQPNDIDRLVEEAEAGVTLQGATANEDKLQPFVPETIERLARAGMSIWMLTGDKQETAINIGWSTRMLRKDMVQLLLTSSSCADAEVGTSHAACGDSGCTMVAALTRVCVA